jgi:8-oxo-dGTP diphosphatase
MCKHPMLVCGEEEVRGDGRVKTRFRSGASISPRRRGWLCPRAVVQETPSAAVVAAGRPKQRWGQWPWVGCGRPFRRVRYVETRVGVGVVVRSLDGRVLVGRRVAERGRLLAIPGGKLDPGESVEACAVRELGEETGLVVSEARTFAAVFVSGWVVAGVRVDLDVTADDVAPQVREPDKFGELAWIDPVNPPEDLFPATAALLERLV